MSDKKKKTSSGGRGGLSVNELQSQKELLNAQNKLLSQKCENQKDITKNLRKKYDSLKDSIRIEDEKNKDIIEFLKKQLHQKQRECIELQDRLTNLEKDRDKIQHEYETNLHSERDGFQNQNTRLLNQLNQLKDELEELNEYRLSKSDYDHELEDLRQSREAEKKLYKDTLYELEVEVVKEKERLKKEKEADIKEAKNKLLMLTASRVDSTTKLTIMENDQMNKELLQQSRQTKELLEENKIVKDRCQKLEQSNKLLSDMQKQVTKQNAAHKNMIKTLLEKMKTLQGNDATEEVEIKNSVFLHGHPTIITKKKPEATFVKQEQPKTSQQMTQPVPLPLPVMQEPQEMEMHILRRQIEDLTAILTEQEESIQSLAEKVQLTDLISRESQKVKEELSQLLNSHDQVTWFLLNTIEEGKDDVLNETASKSTDKENEKNENEIPKVPQNLDELSFTQREKILRYFLSKLYTFQTAASGGIVDEPRRELMPELTKSLGGKNNETYSKFVAPFDTGIPSTTISYSSSSSPKNSPSPQKKKKRVAATASIGIQTDSVAKSLLLTGVSPSSSNQRVSGGLPGPSTIQPLKIIS